LILAVVVLAHHLRAVIAQALSTQEVAVVLMAEVPLVVAVAAAPEVAVAVVVADN